MPLLLSWVGMFILLSEAGEDYPRYGVIFIKLIPKLGNISSDHVLDQY